MDIIEKGGKVANPPPPPPVSQAAPPRPPSLMEVSSIAPRQGMELFSSRPGRQQLDVLPRWDVVIECVDWNRVLIEAEGLHQRKLREDRTHSRIVGGCPTETCGPCLKDVLLDRNWSAAL